jgi:hypothetical protein
VSRRFGPSAPIEERVEGVARLLRRPWSSCQNRRQASVEGERIVLSSSLAQIDVVALSRLVAESWRVV